MPPQEKEFKPRFYPGFSPPVQLDLNRLLFVANIPPGRNIPWKEEVTRIEYTGWWKTQAFVTREETRELSEGERKSLIRKTRARLIESIYNAGGEAEINEILSHASSQPPDPSSSSK